MKVQTQSQDPYDDWSGKCALCRPIQRTAGKAFSRAEIGWASQLRKFVTALNLAGSNDVDCFMPRFRNLANANQLASCFALLHIRNLFQDNATDCSNYSTIEEMFSAFKTRYKFTEACLWLASLQSNTKTLLEDYAKKTELRLHWWLGTTPKGNCDK